MSQRNNSLRGRWLARVLVVAIPAAVLIGIAMIPLRSNKGGAGDVWPLPLVWGRHHLIAAIEMVFAWIAVGVGLIFLAVSVSTRLWELADWKNSRKPRKRLWSDEERRRVEREVGL
jgi:hypothetical protein